MNPLAELDSLDLDPVAKSQVAAMFQTLLAQVERDAKTLQAKDLKIEALTLPPSKRRPNSFRMASLAAQWRNPNAPAPDANPYPTICPVSTTSMSRHPALAGIAAKTWSKSARMSPNNWMSNPPNSLSAAISVPNMPAALAKPSPPPRFRLP